MDAINLFENIAHQFNPAEIKIHAEQFSQNNFKVRFKSYIDKILK